MKSLRGIKEIAKAPTRLVQCLVNFRSGWLLGPPQAIPEDDFADPIQPFMALGPAAVEQGQIEIFDELITLGARQRTMQNLISGRF